MTDIEIKVGDLLRDNDPRQEGRMVRVTGVFAFSVHAEGLAGFRRVIIQRKRIHSDGKPRRSGFSLEREETAQ